MASATKGCINHPGRSKRTRDRETTGVVDPHGVECRVNGRLSCPGWVLLRELQLHRFVAATPANCPGTTPTRTATAKCDNPLHKMVIPRGQRRYRPRRKG